MTKVTVLSAPGCAPCAQAKKILQQIARQVPLEIEEINVMGRPDLLEKHRFAAMPGIVIDGKLEFAGPPSEKELMERLINKEKNKVHK